MILTLLALLAFAAIVSLPVVEPWFLRRRERKRLERCSVSPDELHSMLKSGQRVVVFDVRKPGDLLSQAQVIPGSRRVPPKDIITNPAMVPRNKVAVFYCTCPDEETSRRAMRRARDLGLFQVRVLQGGLVAWKAHGYPVEAYNPFPFDIAS